MADIQPLRALRYEPSVAGPLQDLIAPPYDVIDDEQRAALVARSRFNVVQIDLPTGSHPYTHAAATLDLWRKEGAVVEDEGPALWILRQDYTGPDGRAMTRQGFSPATRAADT